MTIEFKKNYGKNKKINARNKNESVSGTDQCNNCETAVQQYQFL